MMSLGVGNPATSELELRAMNTKTEKTATSTSKTNAQSKAATKRILQPTAAPTVPVAEKQQVQKYMKLVAPKVVESRYTVKENEDATDELAVVTRFDYTNCTEEDILNLATSSVRITIQGRIRKMTAEARKLYAATPQTVDVKAEIVAAARQQRDPMDRMVADLARAKGWTEARARPVVERMLAAMEE